MDRDVRHRGREHERDSLHQVRANQLHRREPRVEHEQSDHDHRARSHARDAHQQATQHADQQRGDRPHWRVRVARVAAGADTTEVDVQPQGIGRGREEQGEADA